MSRAARLATVIAILAALVVLAIVYFFGFLRARPATVDFAPAAKTSPVVDLTLQTVASMGTGSKPDWVSYLVKNADGQWEHSTIWHLPAHALVKVTVYQYDTATGLRNPLWGLPRGIVGNTFTVDGKTMQALDPDLASHTFAIPDLGVSVPLMGVADDAQNQCSVAPCTLSEAHKTVTFSFRTGAPGLYRWQCFVPCAAGWLYGNGGPMQTIGYMDGFLRVG